MTKKLSVAVLAGALLLSGALVGVSLAGSGSAKITEPETISLHTDICGGGVCLHYPLRQPGKEPSGQVTLAKTPVTDVDGTRVGTVNTSCTVSTYTSWVCTLIVKLNAGPYTEAGTIVATGIYGSPGDDKRDVHAITGGTGAYVNVGGTISQESHSGENFILTLVP
jgi:hypothetical protein